MESIRIGSLMGGSLQLDMPEPGRHPSFFAFSLHKAGSTLLFEMLREGAAAAGMPTVDIPQAAFGQGMLEAHLDDSINHAFKGHGYGYLGWRFFPFTSRFPHDRVKNILLVRDPRDILVSLYFSITRSHVLPEKGMMNDVLLTLREKAQGKKIDDWIFDEGAVGESLFGSWARLVLNQFKRYEDFLPPTATRTYRYEDVIFRKREWLADMLGHLGMELPEKEIFRIADRHDVLPGEERPEQHVRQVHPGNHEKHLVPETIGRLNEFFAEILEQFAYLPGEDYGRKMCFTEGDSIISKEVSVEAQGGASRDGGPEVLSSDREVEMLRQVCAERLRLIERIHKEADEMRGELKRLRSERERS